MILFDETSGLYTLVMEFCPSNLFQQVLEAKHRAMIRGSYVYQPPAQTLDWLGQIFLGLEHMHNRLEILFRDLKPDNVVIDSDLCAKLADFGSGRFGASTGAFSFGHPAGTVGYCAPEVLSGQSHDKEADLYSFGVVTWLLFTGGMYNTGPPIAQRQQFEEHLNDWFLLQTCLEKNWPPFRGMEGDPKVPAQQAALAARFTWLLVQRWPGQRMKHEDIRKSPLLAPLQLPRFEDGPEQVERWLQHRKHGDSRDSRPRSSTVPSPPLAPLAAERSDGSDSDITASWSP